MDIQGYIIDHWMAKLSDEHPVLLVFDKDGLYHELLPQVEERGVKVIDTTRHLLNARLNAQHYWAKELGHDTNHRMLIYRRREVPTDRKWVEEPFAAFSKSGVVFPHGPQDSYMNICLTFLPIKKKDIEQLFANDGTSFNKINALLEGAAYPELEQMTGGKSTIEMTTRMLALTRCDDMRWTTEWQRFAELQFPDLDATGSTLYEIQTKLWSYLLFSEFVFDLPESLPANLSSVPHAPEEMKEKVYNVCESVRNMNNLREEYLRMANKVTDQLNLKEVFAKAKHLGERVTFGFENTVEYNRFISLLKEGKQVEAERLYKKNKKDVWYEVDANVACFWQLADYVLQLIGCISNGVCVDGTLEDIVNWYTATGCVADNAYRKFHTHLIDAPSIAQVSELTDMLNTKYREFTERGVRAYQKHIKEIKQLNKLRNQGCVEVVYPALQKGKRVALFMVDAMRYEMGKELTLSLENTFAGRVSCDSKVAYLPSVTRFGMANHLGNIVARPVDGKLQPFIGDTQISLPADRIAYLQAQTGVKVQDVALSDFDSTPIAEDTNLLVVRSIGIDGAGENKSIGIAAMNNELKLIAKVVNECRRKKFDVAVLVADHGFMLQPAFRKGDLIAKPVGSDVVLEESRLLVGNMNGSAETLSFAPAELGADIEAMKMCYASDFTLFRSGDTYFHEGLSLQENVVPVITVTLQEKEEKSDFTLTMKYREGREGTIFMLRPRITFHCSFADLFAKPVHVRLEITGDNGELVGGAIGGLYDEINELINIPGGLTEAKQTLMIDEEYRGSKLTITAYDAETNMTLDVLNLNYEND